VKLERRFVEKPWGRTELPSIFDGANGRRIGEIWFQDPANNLRPLLAKYIFTSEKLSVQVHPNDEQARERGLGQGKNECWYILDAQEDAVLGLGLRTALSPDALRSAAADGSIEDLVDWKPVAAGDFVYVPAGTIHAIGAGISLLEFQQNADVTYRLYDYGRPRALHLEDGVAVSRPGYDMDNYRHAGGPEASVLVNGPQFCLVRATSDSQVPQGLDGRCRWVMPLEGTVTSGSEEASCGECLLLEPNAPLSFSEGTTALVGAQGSL
jgi:mannose-6-phosphate isomerase